MLVLLLTAETFAKSYFEEDFTANFDGDYELVSEEKEVEGLEYTMHNMMFPAESQDDGGHDRAKRLLTPTGGNPSPLCIVTFNIKKYKEKKKTTMRDLTIAHVCN